MAGSWVQVSLKPQRLRDSVIVRELPEYLEATRHRVETSLDRAVKRGKLDAAGRDPVLARITLTSELEDVGGADLVIEAVPEKVDLKVSIMKMLDGIVGDHALIASNTSAIPIARLAGEVRDPSRVLGLHFFSPGRSWHWWRSCAPSIPVTRRSRRHIRSSNE